MRFGGTLLAAVALAAAGASSVLADGPRNILWDGGFEVGFGNTFWGVTAGNHGPNLRTMWANGVLKLERAAGSRIYELEEGAYCLCAWVRRGPAFDERPAQVRLVLSNLNYPREREANQYARSFPVPPGEGWHRIAFPVQIKAPFRKLPAD